MNGRQINHHRAISRLVSYTKRVGWKGGQETELDISEHLRQVSFQERTMQIATHGSETANCVIVALDSNF